METAKKPTTEPSWVTDAKTLPLKVLREKYRAVDDARRSMLSNAPRRGLFAHPVLKTLPGLLIEVGDKPSSTHSLDRIDNGRGYEPGNVKWSDKKTQARNRSNVIYLRHEGKEKPLVEWAEATKQHPATLRARRKKGWTDAEIISGRRFDPGSLQEDAGGIWEWTPWPPAKRLVWERAYQKWKWSSEFRALFYVRFAEQELNKLTEDGRAPMGPDCPIDQEWERLNNFWSQALRDARAQLRRAMDNPHLPIAKHPPAHVESQLRALALAKAVTGRPR